jgi:hypothetical protein
VRANTAPCTLEGTGTLEGCFHFPLGGGEGGGQRCGKVWIG